MSRRHVLLEAFGVASTVVATAALGSRLSVAHASAVLDSAASAGGSLPVPDLLSPMVHNGVKVFALEMAHGSTRIRPGTESPTAGFNGAFLGPTLRIADGDRVRFEVTNRLGAPSTAHWHGLHVAPSHDGGPQTVIEPGATWSPEFTVRQGQACTLWYHPHGLGVTAEQVSLGLAGMIIVDDGSAANAALPREYGVDDFPLIMQSTALSASGVLASTYPDFDHGTPQFLVNGARATTDTPTLVTARNRVRLRPLNASLIDTITVVRADGAAFTQVASDAGLLSEPRPITSLRLAPGERADIVIDLAAGHAVTLRATACTEENIDRYTLAILEIATTGTDAPAALPATLNAITALDTGNARRRKITLGARAGALTIDGVAGTSLRAMEDNMLIVGLGATEVWDVVNTTAFFHVFHLHDVPFQVRLPGTDLRWKDTVEVAPRTTVRIAMRFTDFTDRVYMYMLHCHNLLHEDAGMMLGLMVT